MTDKYSDTLLGKEAVYQSEYDPTILHPIERSLGRKDLGIGQQLPFTGQDLWTAYEVSWLDAKGKPVVAIAEFVFDCRSPVIIESKSFKLYLNSFNQTRFNTLSEVQTRLKEDLAAVSGMPVTVNLIPANQWQDMPVASFAGTCIDDFDIDVDCYETNSDLLVLDEQCPAEASYFTHLLRSLCPVTGQPDWGSLVVEFSGAKLSPQGLLKYIISYREHQEFHEQCVERVFTDIMQRCKPDSLTV